MGERDDAAPGAAADVILDDSDDQGRRKALRRAFVLDENPFTFTPYGNHLTSCCSTFVEAQTATTIPANHAAGHVGEYATVEGVVAKVFTSKSGNTFLNIDWSLVVRNTLYPRLVWQKTTPLNRHKEPTIIP